MHFRKTTFIGFLILVAGSLLVLLANPEARTIRSLDTQVVQLKGKLQQIRTSGADVDRFLSPQEQAVLQAFETYLKTYSTPKRYRFEEMRGLFLLLAQVKPVILRLAEAVSTPVPEVGAGELEAPSPPATPEEGGAVAPPTEAPSSENPGFVIREDEGC